MVSGQLSQYSISLKTVCAGPRSRYKQIQPDSPSQLWKPLLKQPDDKKSDLSPHLSLNCSSCCKPQTHLDEALSCLVPITERSFLDSSPNERISIRCFGWCSANMFSCTVWCGPGSEKAAGKPRQYDFPLRVLPRSETAPSRGTVSRLHSGQRGGHGRRKKRDEVARRLSNRPRGGR